MRQKQPQSNLPNSTWELQKPLALCFFPATSILELYRVEVTKEGIVDLHPKGLELGTNLQMAIKKSPPKIETA